MARPLRCLLRLHRWEYGENPETHEQYRVCARCNAYRDRGQHGRMRYLEEAMAWRGLTDEEYVEMMELLDQEMKEVAALMQDLPPRVFQAAVILNEANMLDEKRLDLLKAVVINGDDPVKFAQHMIKLNARR